MKNGSLCSGSKSASSCPKRFLRARPIKAELSSSPLHRLWSEKRITLQFGGTGAIHVIAEITAQGENMIANTEQIETVPAATAEPKATKNARAGKRGAPVATKRAKGAKKATGARDGSKTAKILDLLKSSDGVTAKELMKLTGWQPHSVRGLPVRNRGQEDGPDRHIDQGRGR